MNEREQRGLQLAATAQITRNGNVWEVPSQTQNGRYTVSREDGEFRCSCPDHDLRGVAAVQAVSTGAWHTVTIKRLPDAEMR